MSDTPKLSKGEQNALGKVYEQLKGKSESALHYTPHGVQWRTMENLSYKGMLTYHRGRYGGDEWRLTEQGSQLAAVTDGQGGE